MKKFMRIALVFALAGATLMYTGCTKDYSGDISDLNNQLGKQEAAITTLQAQVAAAQTTANEALEAAKKADDKAAIAELEARIKKLEEAQAKIDAVVEQIKKDTKADVEKALAEIKAEVDALIESIGLTDFQVILPEYRGVLTMRRANCEVRYGQFNGVFSGLKSATWDGPRAEEVAALEKGCFIASPSVDAFAIRVNPVNADLYNAEFTLQTPDGDVAPLDFYPALAYEDIKAASGVWYVPFSVGEITKEFVDENDEDGTWDYSEASLVYNESIRSQYFLVNFEQAEREAFSEFYDESISQKRATGEVTLEAVHPEFVFDAFITKCVNEKYDIVKYGIKYDGLTVSYDLAAVNEYLKDHEYINFGFQVKQLNVNGYIKEQKAADDYVTVCITKSVTPHKVVEHKASLADTAKHEANPYRIVYGANTQTVTIDLAAAAAQWGIEAGSDARVLWEKEFFEAGYTPTVKKVVYYPSDDSTISTSAANVISSVAFNSDPYKTTWNGKATLTFAQDYPTFEYAEKDMTIDPIGKVLYVTLEMIDDDDAYIATVPVQITEPTAESIASWYKWNDITVYYASADAPAPFSLSPYLKIKDGFTSCGMGLAFKSKEVKFANGTKEVWFATQVKGTDELAANKSYTDLGAFVGNPAFSSRFRAKSNNGPAHFEIVGANYNPEDKAWSLANWNEGEQNLFNFVGKKSGAFEVENLYIKAINRTYPIDNAKVNIVVRNTAPSITLSKALELGSTTGSFEVLTDSSFEPYNTPEAFYGTFTLADAEGKAMYISTPSVSGGYQAIREQHTYAFVGGAWVLADGLINVVDQEYECNFGTATAADIRPAYGLKVSAAQDLAAYYGKQIKVEVTFDGNGNPAALSYVATKANIKQHTTVSFVVTIK